MPKFWTEAKITVISQSEKDTTNPELYCPVSLLNCDYKIFTHFGNQAN